MNRFTHAVNSPIFFAHQISINNLIEMPNLYSPLVCRQIRTCTIANSRVSAQVELALANLNTTDTILLR